MNLTYSKRFRHTLVDNIFYFSRGQIQPGWVKSVPRRNAWPRVIASTFGPWMTGAQRPSAQSPNVKNIILIISHCWNVYEYKNIIEFVFIYIVNWARNMRVDFWKSVMIFKKSFAFKSHPVRHSPDHSIYASWCFLKQPNDLALVLNYPARESVFMCVCK